MFINVDVEINELDCDECRFINNLAGFRYCILFGMFLNLQNKSNTIQRCSKCNEIVKGS
jgi:hypothetical protein